MIKTDRLIFSGKKRILHHHFTSKFSMTSFYMASFICQVHVCMCDKFYMTSFWFSDRHDSYYFPLQPTSSTGAFNRKQ